MGIRRYASDRKRRGLPGGTKAAVEAAIRSGRISYDPKQGIDPELADAEWSAATDAEKQRASAGAIPEGAGRQAAAIARIKEAEAELKELQVRQRRGELVEVSRVADLWFEVSRQTRDRVLGVADDIAPELSPLRSSKKIHARLSAALREALEILSKPPTSNGRGKA